MPLPTLSWPQVLRWRLRRHLVDPPGEAGVVAVAERLCGVQAQVPSAAELALAVRTASATAASAASEVSQALTAGRLVRTWSVRGTLHLLPLDMAARQLSLLAAARSWEKGAWQRAFLPSAVVEELAEHVAGALEHGPLTREELAARLEGVGDHPDLAGHLRSGWSAVLKPLAWQGILCQGPPRGRAVTFARPDRLLDGWPGLPDPEDAGPLVVRDYLAAFGPATPEAFGAWLLRGALAKTRLRRWFDALGDALAEVDVEGRPALLARADLDELQATAPLRGAVHLLPAFDQYVLGPGTGDPAVVPAEHRARVSRQAGWISPVVLLDGRVAGTWEPAGDGPQVTPFPGAGLPPPALGDAVEQMRHRLGG